MANATAPVPSFTTPYQDDRVRRPIGSGDTGTYYPMAMIALDGSGNVAKCDNTAGLKFDGVCAEDAATTYNSSVVHKLSVEKPRWFMAAIASAVAGDEGKPVYASFDNTVSYSTTNSIQVGWVEQVLDATHVLIRPMWTGVNGNAVFDGNTLTFTGATAVNKIAVPDNLADGLSIAEGSNEYLTFVTTNSAEKIVASKDFLVGPNGATNPTLQIVTTVSSEAGGLKITGAADAAGVALAAIGSNTNEPLTLDAKGSGTITIGSVSTGGTVMRIKTATVAAAGTVIGNATAVGEGFTYVTGANNVAGIQLPASVVGKQVKITNTVATALLLIYPPASSQINAKGVNNVYNIPNAAERTFTYVSTTLWYTSPETIA